jgi:hypothetical protein
MRKIRVFSLRSEKILAYFSLRFALTENERRTLNGMLLHDTGDCAPFLYCIEAVLIANSLRNCDQIILELVK